MSEYDRVRIKQEQKHDPCCMTCWYWRPEPFIEDGKNWSSLCRKPWNFDGSECSAHAKGRIDTNGGFICGFHKPYSVGLKEQQEANP